MRVVETGTIGVTDGFTWMRYNTQDDIPSSNDIDGDNDGEMNPTHGFLLDLSEIASKKLGRQCSMMQEYKVRSIRIGIRHEDDTIDNRDNDAFAGYIYMYPPTDHLKNALSLCREVEKASESDEIDTDSFLLSSERDYSGFRYGWATHSSAEVKYQTVPSLDIGIKWNLDEIGAVYSFMNGPALETNALWDYRFPQPCVWQWHAKAASGHDGELDVDAGGQIATDFTDDTVNTHFTTIPLIGGRVVWSGIKADNILADDDYTLHVTVDFELAGGVF